MCARVCVCATATTTADRPPSPNLTSPPRLLPQDGKQLQPSGDNWHISGHELHFPYLRASNTGEYKCVVGASALGWAPCPGSPVVGGSGSLAPVWISFCDLTSL